MGTHSSGTFTYFFTNEHEDSFFVYFTLALGVKELEHFKYDPNVLTITYTIPPAYSFTSKTEVYDKINDDFDGDLEDVTTPFTPPCDPGSGRSIGLPFLQFEKR